VAAVTVLTAARIDLRGLERGSRGL